MTVLVRTTFAMLAAALLPAPAFAAISVIGGGLGRECYLAAELNRNLADGLATCDRALAEEAFNRRDRAATLVNRGILHMQNRDFARAIADYDRALATEPKLAEAHVNRGIALLHSGGRDREAVDALTKGLALQPSRPEIAHYSRAVAHELLGNAREAYADYAAAAQLKPDWPEPAEQLKRFSVERRPVARG
jgi:tetratricopeptide (TPR) repeat protein